MKKFILISVLAGVLPFTSMAQDDDLYFTPKKDIVASSYSKLDNYSGSNRNVDEYNRHGKFWSHYQKVGTDDKGNDIIQFTQGNGVYPDSTYIDTTFVGKYYSQMADNDNDYRYSQRMSRWDGFYDPSFYGYGPYWGCGPSWRYGYYDPFYDPWYDPWFSGYYGYGYGYPYSYYRYGGWYDPWYYGYYGYPYYGSGYVSYSRPTGTRNHSFGNGANSGSFAQGNFGGSRTINGSRGFQGSSNRSFGSQNNNARFGGSRAINSQNNTRTFDNSRSYGDRIPTSSYGSSNFGGGSFGGGGHSGGSFGGGGGFGGGHSGGGSFGGHR
jgi:hypothetical protein